MSNKLISALTKVFADTYALYLKAQNFHWHVKGIQFKELHELFEKQYIELAQAVDDLAERIRTLGHMVPSSFSELNELKSLADGDSKQSGEAMLKEFLGDHRAVIKDLYTALKLAQAEGDEGSVVILSDRIAHHEKSAWMIDATIS